MAIKIFTDSASGISPRIIKELDIGVVELTVIWDRTLEQEIDYPSDDLSSFYERLGIEVATTSHPEPARFVSAFSSWLDADPTNEIICITILKEFSHTYYSAISAAEEIDPQGKRITIIDSGSVAMGEGWQVIAAARACLNNKSCEAIVKAVNSNKNKAIVLFKATDLTSLARGGRVLEAILAVQKKTSFVPIIGMTNGKKPQLAGFSLSNGQSFAKMASKASSYYGKHERVRVGILYTDKIGEAYKMLTSISRKLTIVESVIQQPPRVIGAHTGPIGVTGICIFPA